MSWLVGPFGLSTRRTPSMPGVLGRRRAIRSARCVVRAKLRHARQDQGDRFVYG